MNNSKGKVIKLFLSLYTKINSEDQRAKAIKLLEEDIVNLCDLGLSNGFSDETRKAQARREKIRLDLI